MRPRPVLGQRLLVVAWDDLDLQPAWPHIDWIAWAKSLVGESLRVSMVTLKPFGRPALASSSFPFAEVEVVRLVVNRAEEANGRNVWWTMALPYMMLSVSES